MTGFNPGADSIETFTLNEQGGFASGGGSGSIASILLRNNFDVGALRPWLPQGAQIGGPGLISVTRNGKPQNLVTNDAVLHKQDWLEIDRAVMEAAKPNLNLVADLRGAGLVKTITGGMGKTILESQTVGDTGPAQLSMDGRTRGQNDRPEFGLVGIPLVIASRDWQLGAREIAESRQNGEGIDTINATQAGRRVAEIIEQMTTGEQSYTYGGYTVYGYSTFPYRNTKTLTAPTANGWAPHVLVSEVLDMRQKSVDDFYRGPWVLYHSRAWDQYLEEDYVPEDGTNSSGTLRERLAKIDGIRAVKPADYLKNSTYDMVLVQMTSDVVRLCIGMEIITLQWPGQGGLELNFKTLGIQVPQIRADKNQRCGLVHGATA